MIVKHMKCVYSADSRQKVDAKILSLKRTDKFLHRKKKAYNITSYEYRDGTKRFYVYESGAGSPGKPMPIVKLSDRLLDMFTVKSKEVKLRGNSMLFKVPKKGDVVMNKATKISSVVYNNEKGIPTTFDGKRFYSFGPISFPERKKKFKLVTGEQASNIERLSPSYRKKWSGKKELYERTPESKSATRTITDITKSKKLKHSKKTHKKRKYTRRVKSEQVKEIDTSKLADKVLAVFGLKRR